MSKAKVLIVEDNPTTRSLLEQTLVMEGFDVSSVGDGLRALSKIRSEPPSLVVLDLMMPGMDGFSVLQEIRADETTQEMPVLILSALDDNESTWRGWANGCHYYMTKPFEIEDLIAVVKKLAKGVPA